LIATTAGIPRQPDWIVGTSIGEANMGMLYSVTSIGE
jgi:hypothetical protein